MASIAASTGEEAAAIGEDTRVPGADAERGGSIPKDSQISEWKLFNKIKRFESQESISTGKPEVGIRRSRYSSAERATEFWSEKDSALIILPLSPPRRTTYEVSVKTTAITRWRLLTEHQRKKFKGVLLKANGVKNK